MARNPHVRGGVAAGRDRLGLHFRFAEYQAALAIDPIYGEARQNLEIARRDLAAAHYNNGVALARAGRAAEAVAEFEQSLRIAPDNAEAHNNLGVVLSQMPGRLAEAIAQFEAAVRLKPDYEDAQYNLKAAPGELAASPQRR